MKSSGKVPASSYFSIDPRFPRGGVLYSDFSRINDAGDFYDFKKNGRDVKRAAK